MLLPILAALAWAAPEDQVLINASGEYLHWASADVPFRVNASNVEGIEETKVFAAVSAAASAWSLAEGVHVAYLDEGVTTEMGGLDEANVVYFNDDWTSSPDLLALTSSWSDENGVIVEFDLAVNTADHEWSTNGEKGKCDLQNTLTHEFGHGLGLDHDAGNASATMYASAVPGETLKRDLEQSDRDVAAWLYPAPGSSPEERPLALCSPLAGAATWSWLPILCLTFFRRKEVA